MYNYSWFPLVIDVVICFIGVLFQKVKQVLEDLLHVLYLKLVRGADEAALIVVLGKLDSIKYCLGFTEALQGVLKVKSFFYNLLEDIFRKIGTCVG